jgi:hypothetical protein
MPATAGSKPAPVQGNKLKSQTRKGGNYKGNTCKGTTGRIFDLKSVTYAMNPNSGFG